ncbi:MAG: hypothetical protein HYU99_10900 [Deltaproteobacteria bacterium]|nr:hypothetical protein [Deltaproteobacteria bacterium]
MSKFKGQRLVFLLFLWFFSTGQTCTKEIVYGKDYYTLPKHAWFLNDKETVMKAVQRALEHLGYEINNTDEEKGRFITGWRPVEGDSHYYNLFGRRDYGITDGAYYQMTVDLTQEGSQIKVAVGTTVKTIVGKLESAGKVEGRVIAELETYLRPPQIEMTNVGVRKK